MTMRLARRMAGALVSLFCPVAIGATAPDPIPLEYFGIHIHRAETGVAWPSMPVGSWRLWDAAVAWQQIEPRRNEWDFSRLDRLVEIGRNHNVDMLLPLAATPRWASARPDEAGTFGPGAAAEPANIEDWRAYVAAVGNRYKGKIRHYEIWNEPSDRGFFSGSVEQLVTLACEASRILKGIDPLNAVVSPASAGGGRHIAYLDHFLASGGKDCIDIVAHHFYVWHLPPEGMVPLIRDVREVMKRNGIGSKPLWNTETGWWIENGSGGPYAKFVTGGGWNMLALKVESADYVEHALLLARAEGVGRFFWYAWNNQSMGMIDPKSGAEKPMVDRWRSTVTELVGASNLDCEEANQGWSCSYTRKDGMKRRIAWQTPPAR